VLLELGLSDSVTDEERSVVLAAIAGAEGAVRRHLRYDPVQRRRTEYYPQQQYGRRGGRSAWEVEGSSAVLRTLDVGASRGLQVRHLPIRESPAIQLYVDHDARSGTRATAFADSSLKTEGTDYWPNYDGEDSGEHKLCRDGIIWSSGWWGTSPGTVKIIYTAGYTAAELHGQDWAVDAMLIVVAAINEAARYVKKAMANKKSSSVGWASGPLASERLDAYSYTVDTSALNRLFGGMDLLPENELRLEEFVNLGWCLGS